MNALKKTGLALVLTALSFYANACGQNCNGKIAPEQVKVFFCPQDKACVQHVNVKFTVTNEGKVFVKKIDTDNLQLKKYVMAKLSRLHFEGMDVQGTYDITISFSSKDQLT